MILWMATAAAVVAGMGLFVARVGRRRRVVAAQAYADIWSSLDAELERARRHDRTVALIRLSTKAPEGVDVARVATLNTRLRSSDRVTYTSHDAIVLAPETDTTGATTLARRLRDHLGTDDATVRIACFPHDALTRHALVQAINRPASRRAVRPTRQLGARRAM